MHTLLYVHDPLLDGDTHFFADNDGGLAEAIEHLKDLVRNVLKSTVSDSYDEVCIRRAEAGKSDFDSDVIMTGEEALEAISEEDKKSKSEKDDEE